MDPIEIGATIRRARKKLQLTQADVAAAANVGVRFVVEMESGKATARLDKLLAVVRVLGLEIKVTDA